MNEAYRAQVRLMLDLLPLVAEETAFALKGGTAINFFVRDMPRLSLDIDLTYLPVDDRAASLAGISEGLTRIKARAEDRVPRARVTLVPQGDDMEVKVHCQRGRARVKIEVNPLQRGSLWPVRQLACTDAVQEAFESFVELTSSAARCRRPWTDSTPGTCSTFDTCSTQRVLTATSEPACS
jgi:phosphopantothenate synthetase